MGKVMTEFEKWFSKLDDEQLTRFTKQNRFIAKLSWKAALSMLRRELKEIDNGKVQEETNNY